MSLQQDFATFFQLLKQVHLTKEEWRGRAQGFMAQQDVSQPTFTEYKTNKKNRKHLAQ